ncbi:MAG: hypothetical protein ACFCU4_01020 [Puniceicoccaceae bacterium]
MPEFEYASPRTIAERIGEDYLPGESSRKIGEELLPRSGDAEELAAALGGATENGDLVLDEDGNWLERVGRDRGDAESTSTLREAREVADEGDENDELIEDGFGSDQIVKPDWIDRLGTVVDRYRRWVRRRKVAKEKRLRLARKSASVEKPVAPEGNHAGEGVPFSRSQGDRRKGSRTERERGTGGRPSGKTGHRAGTSSRPSGERKPKGGGGSGSSPNQGHRGQSGPSRGMSGKGSNRQPAGEQADASRGRGEASKRRRSRKPHPPREG